MCNLSLLEMASFTCTAFECHLDGIKCHRSGIISGPSIFYEHFFSIVVFDFKKRFSFHDFYKFDCLFCMVKIFGCFGAMMINVNPSSL